MYAPVLTAVFDRKRLSLSSIVTLRGVTDRKKEEIMASRRVSGSRCSSGIRHELLDLANHLRQERLFVQSEKSQVSH